jgi:hypothetical protein
MTKEYKITIWSFLKEWGGCIFVVLFVLYLLYLSHKPSSDLPYAVNKSKLIPIVYTLVMLVIGLSPMIVLLNHYGCDKNTVLIIDTDSSEFIYKNGDYSKSEKIKDIKLVKIYYCPKCFPMRYFEIYLSDNTQLIVSSLVETSWIDYLDSARIVIEPKFITLI